MVFRWRCIWIKDIESLLRFEKSDKIWKNLHFAKLFRNFRSRFLTYSRGEGSDGGFEQGLAALPEDDQSQRQGEPNDFAALARSACCNALARL